jgi:hypothetical protein
MLEVEAVANALGEKMAVDVDARLNGAAEVGEHKTSMLQDLELGRPMEVDAIVSAVVELARITRSRRRTSTRSTAWCACWWPVVSSQLSVLPRHASIARHLYATGDRLVPAANACGPTQGNRKPKRVQTMAT